MVKRTIVCPDCGETKSHHAKGLCGTCYRKQWRKASPVHKKSRLRYQREKREGKVGRKIVCKECGKDSIHYGHGMCHDCYVLDYRARPESKKLHADYERKRRAENAKEYREYERKRRQRPKEKLRRRKYSHGYYRENQEKLKAYAIEYRKADTARQTIYKQRRRHRDQGLPATLTPQEWDEILEENNYSCFYCGATDIELEMEHMLPSSRGGGLVRENIVPSCGDCNRSKKTMTVDEYRQFLIDVGEIPQF